MTDTPDDRPEGHDRIISKGPCDKCQGSKCLALYGDGHMHCHKCGHHTPADTQGASSQAGRPSPSSGSGSSSKLLKASEQTHPWVDRKSRGITSETLRKFGSFNAGFKGQKAAVYPYYLRSTGELAIQKLRLPAKDFPQLKAADDTPGIANCHLYGWHVFGDRFDRRVVVTEGEEDAHAVAQETDFKFAVVSPQNGAGGAAACLKANYLWLDRFAEIVLWFDNDAPGREAAEECAKLFKVGKVRIASAPPGYKDANDLLIGDDPKPGLIQESIYAAKAWRPRGIVNAATTKSDVFAPREQTHAYHYPDFMPILQEMTGGVVKGEVIYHVAGTGVGKSSQLREIQYALLQQGAKIAVLSFEDTVRDAKFGLMSIAAGRRLHLQDLPEHTDLKGLEAYDAEMGRWHDVVFGKGLVELFDPETAEWQMDSILGYIRYCAKALDCEVVFIDPLSFVAAGIELSADERRVLDKVAAELAKLAKELGINIQVSHHLKRAMGTPHEEGAPTSLNELRSSGGLANFAMCVVGWERNNQAPDPLWRVTRSRVLKPARRVGRSGLADVLFYEESGRTIKSPHDFPPPGKPESDDAGEQPSRKRGFGPITEQDY